jgi:hypothetical protein
MPLGTLEEVEQRLSALVPEMAWQRSGAASFGRSRSPAAEGIEFQPTPDDDGLCRALTVRRITRPQLEELCRRLGVVAVDSQNVGQLILLNRPFAWQHPGEGLCTPLVWKWFFLPPIVLFMTGALWAVRERNRHASERD